MVVSSREIVEDVISNTGSNLTVSYKRHRMLNHAKSKDAFARFEADFGPGKVAYFRTMQKNFSMGISFIRRLLLNWLCRRDVVGSHQELREVSLGGVLRYAA